VSAEPVLFERADGVVTLTLNAPERGNSVDGPLLTRLEELLGEVQGARVVLLKGAGERSFCTGYHVPALVAELEEGESVSDFEGHPLERALRALEAVPVPTVAVVGGNAYGAGCELALACDLRLAAESARFCMPPARLGVLYSATGIRRLLELVGPAVAQEMLYTACVVDGPRALAVGLVNRLAPRAELDRAAADLAATIAGNAPLSVRHTKTILREHLATPALEAEALAQVAALRAECFRSEDFRRRAARLASKGAGGGGRASEGAGS
jgi:enoyl-CoA hydratase/carnithine racemase